MSRRKSKQGDRQRQKRLSKRLSGSKSNSSVSLSLSSSSVNLIPDPRQQDSGINPSEKIVQGQMQNEAEINTPISQAEEVKEVLVSQQSVGNTADESTPLANVNTESAPPPPLAAPPAPVQAPPAPVEAPPAPVEAPAAPVQAPPAPVEAPAAPAEAPAAPVEGQEDKDDLNEGKEEKLSVEDHVEPIVESQVPASDVQNVEMESSEKSQSTYAEEEIIESEEKNAETFEEEQEENVEEEQEENVEEEQEENVEEEQEEKVEEEQEEKVAEEKEEKVAEEKKIGDIKEPVQVMAAEVTKSTEQIKSTVPAEKVSETIKKVSEPVEKVAEVEKPSSVEKLPEASPIHVASEPQNSVAKKSCCVIS